MSKRRSGYNNDKKIYRHCIPPPPITYIYAYVTTPTAVTYYNMETNESNSIFINNPTAVIFSDKAYTDKAYIIHQNFISFYSIHQGALYLFGAIYLNAPTSLAFNNNIAYVTTPSAVSYYTNTFELLGTKTFINPIFITFNNNIGYVINAINPSMSYISYHRPDTLKEFGKKLYLINPTTINFYNNIAYVTTPISVSYYSVAPEGQLTLLGQINIALATSVAFCNDIIYITSPSGISYYSITYELLGTLDIVGTSIAIH